jgi:glyoxylase-like metal-dependent hydrolase (beta-lactamase superfamily II)
MGLKLYVHYCPFVFSNCYILGSEALGDEIWAPDEARPSLADPPPETDPFGTRPARETIIIDPGIMDESILDFIEKNNYILRGVFITHDHLGHVRGLRTLTRIYDTKIFAVNPVIQDIKTTIVRDGDTVALGSFKIEVVSVPGHSADSAVFKCERMLFTGDSLTAGLVGRTASTYGAAIQVGALRAKLLSLPGDYIVLPGHGPPSTLEAERRFNVGIRAQDQQKNQRPAFRVDF